MEFLTSAALGVTMQASSDDGLSIAEIIANIPHDFSAVVIYAMIVGSVVFVWCAGRSRPPTSPTA